jgi:hypothetical protein
MFDRMVLALSAALLIAPAAAKDCPTQEFSHEAREEVVRKAASCKDSLEVMEACAYGASGDTGLGEIVMEKCEADFLTKLSKAQRQTYDRGIKRCDDKYKNQSGTMYRSFSAFCRATLARDSAAKFVKAKK